MKKILSLAFIVLAVSPLLARATAQRPTDTPATPGVNFQNTEFIGVGEFRLETSTGAGLPVLLKTLNGQTFTAPGLLYAISSDSGTAGDFCMALDSAAVASVTVLTQGKSIGPKCLSSGASNAQMSPTGCTVPGQCGLCTLRDPARFENGLVGIKGGSGNNNCIFYVRSDAGNNPIP